MYNQSERLESGGYFCVILCRQSFLDAVDRICNHLNQITDVIVPRNSETGIRYPCISTILVYSTCGMERNAEIIRSYSIIHGINGRS